MPPSTSSPSLSLSSPGVLENESVAGDVGVCEGNGDRVGNTEGVTGFEGGGLLRARVPEEVLDADGVGCDVGVMALDAEGSAEGDSVAKEVWEEEIVGESVGTGLRAIVGETVAT